MSRMVYAERDEVSAETGANSLVVGQVNRYLSGGLGWALVVRKRFHTDSGSETRMDHNAHRLVVQALTCTLSNCVEWINNKEANRVRSDPANQGLRPWEIIRLLREFVRRSGLSCVEQIREEREGWRD